MSTFETTTSSGRRADRVATAFYRFLELHGDEATEAAMHIVRNGNESRITIRLWSQDSVIAYTDYLATFVLPQRRPWARSQTDTNANAA